MILVISWPMVNTPTGKPIENVIPSLELLATKGHDRIFQ